MLFKIGAGLCCFPQRNASALGWGLFFAIGTFVCVAQGTGYVVKLNLPYQAAALAQLWGYLKSQKRIISCSTCTFKHTR